jgi:hypothetical protein
MKRLIVFVFVLSAQFVEAKDFETLESSYYVGKIHVNNLPLRIRDVPVHPDDSWARDNAGPIEQKSYSIPAVLELGYRWGKYTDNDTLF